MLLDTSQRASQTQLRWFAGLWLPAAFLVIAWSFYRNDSVTTATGIAAAGVTLGILGLLVPAVASAIYRTLLWVTMPIGWVLSWVILITLYFAILTPLGKLLRLFHDPMQRQLERAAGSYWTRRRPAPAARYFRQF